MTTSEKAQDLFESGVGSFEEGNYNEALHYFKESQKIEPSDKIEEKIKQCQEKIKEKQQRTNTSSDGADNGDNPTKKSEEEIECENVIAEKDYYKLLGVTKDTVTPEELKKVYKKLAIKFHPDKNKSSKAEDAFKKISAAYQTINDPEKRKLYDKYGTEEEYREKYYQANQQRYEEEEDAYDIFDILFQNPNGQRRRRTRVRFENATPEEQRRMKWMQLLQLAIPLIMVLYSILPQLFAEKPLYGFELSQEFKVKGRTHINKIDYFYGENFHKTFPDKTTKKEEDHNIELAYLEYANSVCEHNRHVETQLKYGLNFNRRGTPKYYDIMRRLQSIDYTLCDQYEKLKPLIDNYIENSSNNEEEDDEEEEEQEGLKKNSNKQEDKHKKKTEVEQEDDNQYDDDDN